jgi:hypothetical protein
VEPFGIKVTLVEPGFFRKDLLAPRLAGLPPASSRIIPAKLGRVLVQLATMNARRNNSSRAATR